MGSTNQTRILGKCTKQITIEMMKEADKTASFFCENKNLFKICKAENYN